MSFTAHHPLINCQPAQSPRTPTLAGSIARTLRLWHSRINQRRALPVLDERDLRDMRLSRWDVERELAKPFWRG